jgi:hypothetical protein
LVELSLDAIEACAHALFKAGKRELDISALLGEVLVDGTKLPVDLFEALVDLFEALVDLFEAPINFSELTVNRQTKRLQLGGQRFDCLHERLLARRVYHRLPLSPCA